MADNDVRIKLSLDGADQVSSGLAGVGDGAEQADSKVSSLVKGGLAGAGKALVGFSIAAVAASTALAVGVVKAYADAEQSVGGIETLFGTSADAMKNYAKDAYKDAGLSANEYMEQATSMSASLIQSVGGDTAKAAELANVALVSMSDNANKMGTDLGSIQNAFAGFAKGNYTMLDNLKLGYGGTQEEMARLLSDAEKLPSAMGQKFDISNYGDVVQAIQLVQEEMGIAGTTALEANETISGSVGMLRGSFDNLLVAMGSANNESLAFLDVQEQAANVVASFESVVSNITPVIESIGSSMGTLGPQLGSMMVTVVQAISAAIPAVLDAGVALVEGLVTGVTEALPSLVTALVPGVTGLAESLATLAPQLISAGAAAVVALVEGLASAAPTLIPALTEGITGMVDAVIQSAPMLLTAGISLIQGLVDGVMTTIPMVIEAIPDLIDGIISFIITGVPLLLDAGIQLFTGLIEAIPEVITQIVAVLPGMITSIIEALVTLIPMLVDAGVQLLTSLVDNLPLIITTIVEAIPLIISSVLDAVLGAIPTIIEGGIELFIALIGALPQIITTIIGAIPKIIDGVLTALTGSIPQLIMAGVQLLVALVQNMPAILGGIVRAIPQIIGGIVGAIVGAVPKIAEAGLQLIQGLWQGISNATGWLMGKIGGFVDNVMGGIKDFFGIKSPSRLMEDEVGEWLPPGIGAGVEKNEDAAIEPIKTLGKKMTLTAKQIEPLDMSQAFMSDSSRVRTVPSKAAAYNPAPISFTSTQTLSLGDSMAAALTKALEDVSLQADVTSRIDQRDMDNMANKVHSALVEVRREDSRSASLSVQQRVR